MATLAQETIQTILNTQTSAAALINSSDPVETINNLAQTITIGADIIGNPMGVIAANGLAFQVTFAKMQLDARDNKPISMTDMASLLVNAVAMGAAIGVIVTPAGRAAQFFRSALIGLGWGQLALPLLINDAVAGSYNTAKNWVQRRDPLIFDLDGDGLETVGVSTTNPILFDHDGDGTKNGTGWVAPDDAFLVLDRNSNGTIDSGRELFGDSTIKSNGQAAIDGFDALADLDTDADGVVNVSDAQFANLRLWRDLNQDGISQSNELFTLASQNIASINVAKTINSQTLANGNQIADLGTYTRTDGSSGVTGEVTGDMADINLADDTFHRTFPDTLDTTAVQHLPDMQGSGKVRDLLEATTQSTTLQNLLAQYSAATSRSAQLALLDQLLDAWADTSGMLESFVERVEGVSYKIYAGETLLGEVPYVVRYQSIGNVQRTYKENAVSQGGSGGGNSLYGGTDLDDDSLTDSYRQLIASWDQKIHIIEAFNGSYFFGLPESPQPNGARTGMTINSGGGGGSVLVYAPIEIRYNQTQLDFLQQSYDALRQSVYNSLLLQTRFKSALDSINLVVDESGIRLDFTQLDASFDAEIAANPTNGLIDFLEFSYAAKDMLAGTGWQGWQKIAELLEVNIDNQEVRNAMALVGYKIKGMAGFDNALTGTSSDVVVGANLDDVVYAGNSDDVLLGLDGNDVLYGMEGTDSLNGGAGNDTLYSHKINAYSNNDNISTEDTLEGGTGDDILYGTGGANTYVYNLGDGADMIYANGGGATTNGALDKLKLGAGINPSDLTFTMQNSNLVIKFANAGDQVTFSNWFTTNHSYRLASIEFADGTVWGQSDFNRYAGTSGDDYINGDSSFVADETINGLAGNDTIYGGTGTDTLIGGAGNDNLYAFNTNSTSKDQLTNDVLEGGTGNDRLYGTGGANTFIYNLGDGADIVDASGYAYSTSTGPAIDKLKLGAGISAADVTFSRVSNNLVVNFTNPGDKITFTNWYSSNTQRLASIEFADGTISSFLGTLGTIGIDYLMGTTGADTMVGGLGNDVYFVDSTSDLVTEDQSGGNDYIYSTVTYTLSNHLENLTLIGSSSINGTGNNLDNQIKGNDSDNTLNGGAGIDTLIGGIGNDVYVVDTSTDTIVEKFNEGSDTVQSSVTITIAQNVENLTLTGASAIDGTGNTLDNTINGNAASNMLIGGDGNDTLNGLSGNDIMEGGQGNDIYHIDSIGDVIVEAEGAGIDTINVSIASANGTYDVGNHFENAILLNSLNFNLNGNAFSNYLRGNTYNNILADISGGNDIYQGLAGTDTINDNIGSNLYDGGTGTDTFNAGAGNDLFIGGAGNDVITTGDGYDVISFNKGSGFDIINASTGSDNTISLGGYFAYSDLSLTKSTNDLIIKMGATDQITFKDWYASGTNNKSVVNLQVIAEAMQGFTLGGADQLSNNKVESFNFASLVDAFDADVAINAANATNWQLTDVRLTAHLQSGSNTEAIGGDLAYQYGKNSSLAGMGLINAQSVISNASFGQTAQTLNNPSVWQAELVKLA